MGFFSNPKIEGKELQECLSYFEVLTKVIAFQTKEADIYNDTMVKYGNSVQGNPLAARETCKAANRLVQSMIEVLRRHQEIKNVPAAASAMHYAWYLAFNDNKTWASATSKAIEAVAEGMTPNLVYVEQLVQQYKRSWRSADAEDKKFVKRLNIKADELAEIIGRAMSGNAADTEWQSKHDSEN